MADDLRNQETLVLTRSRIVEWTSDQNRQPGLEHFPTVADVAARPHGAAVELDGRYANDERILQDVKGALSSKALRQDAAAGVGALLGLAALTPLTSRAFFPAAAFVAFRFFDILKPGPIGWADRQKGPMGVMLDDVLAGIAAAVIVMIAAGVYHGLIQ